MFGDKIPAASILDGDIIIHDNKICVVTNVKMIGDLMEISIVKTYNLLYRADAQTILISGDTPVFVYNKNKLLEVANV
jgi:hypothetical protein